MGAVNRPWPDLCPPRSGRGRPDQPSVYRDHNSRQILGQIKAIGHQGEGIKIPRNFNIDPSGKWMLVANQDGASVVVFAIGADGLPKPTGTRVEVPNPVCVKFLAKP